MKDTENTCVTGTVSLGEDVAVGSDQFGGSHHSRINPRAGLPALPSDIHPIQSCGGGTVKGWTCIPFS